MDDFSDLGFTSKLVSKFGPATSWRGHPTIAGTEKSEEKPEMKLTANTPEKLQFAPKGKDRLNLSHPFSGANS